VELRSKQNQSLKEFVQVKVYDTLQSYLRDLEKYQYDNQETASNLIHTRAQLEREKMERENLHKQLKDVREDSRRRIEALEMRNKDLQSDLNQLQSQAKQGETSKRKAEELLEKLRATEAEGKHLKAQLKDIEQHQHKT